VERIAKKRPAERARASRPVVATVASGRDRRHPRARPHPVRRGTDRGQVIDSERKARREAGFNSKKRRAVERGETADRIAKSLICNQPANHRPACPRARDSHSDSTLPPRRSRTFTYTYTRL